jgi:hypothetical protein
MTADWRLWIASRMPTQAPLRAPRTDARAMHTAEFPRMQGEAITSRQM